MRKLFSNFKLGNISICRLETEENTKPKFKFFKHIATGLTFRMYDIGRNHRIIVNRILKGYNKNLYAYGLKIPNMQRKDHIRKYEEDLKNKERGIK